MGKVFGELAVIRGILYYSISPHEIRTFAGALKYGLPNMVPRVSARLWTYLPVSILGYVVYATVEEVHHHNTRKDHKLYINEINPNPPPPPVPEKVPEEKCKKEKK